jgi:hypothetical protein
VPRRNNSYDLLALVGVGVGISVVALSFSRVASRQGVPSVSGLPDGWDIRSAGQRIFEAYKGYPYMNEDLAAQIAVVADRLDANPFLLANVLRAESQFSPRAQAVPGPVLERAPTGKPAVFAFNPKGGATGILQWIPARAEELGTSLEELFYTTDPSEQMPYVEDYFEQFKPFPTKQSLYLSVFQPSARKADPNKPFSDPAVAAQHATPADYMAFVDKYARLRADGEIRTSVPASGFLRPPSPETAEREQEALEGRSV